MKRIFLLVFVFLMVGSLNGFAGNYTIDDSRLDQLFASTETIVFNELTSNVAGSVYSGIPSLASRDKDPLVAILLDILVGALGVHRFYLGTEVLTGIGYILTCGGIFGIVPLVDLIVLAINYDDISPYIDNPKFFMW